MAVPKKKTSKSRKNIRIKNWKKKASKKASLAFSLGRSFVENKISNHYIFI